jgi:alcohol dehydrogenase (cytochrome c)
VLWEFDVIPGPGDPVYDTWQPTPPAWEKGVGGAAAWGAGGYDPVTRTVIYGTGQPNPWDRLDWRRGQPKDEPPSPDLYSASYVALDVDTGELKWYHQVVPADEWDFDQFTTPMWLDLEIEGVTRRVVVLSLITGWLVLLDAESGELIAAHQKHPEANIHLGYAEDGTSIINPEMRYDEYGQEKRVCPGLRWAWWGTAAYHPGTGLYYSPNNHVCRTMALTGSIGDDWQPGQGVVRRTALYPPENFFERLGGLEAIDPISGETMWEYGSEYMNQGGTMATAGDVVFGAFIDRGFRAFDARTGELLFEQYMPSMLTSSPITYEVNGRQYVATLVGNSLAGAPGAMPGLPMPVSGPPQIFVFALP